MRPRRPDRWASASSPPRRRATEHTAPRAQAGSMNAFNVPVRMLAAQAFQALGGRSLCDDGLMPPRVPAVDPASLAGWCTDHLGSAPAAELFRSGHLSAVLGLHLADGRDVVVKVRPASPRVAACVEVQRRMFESGYPCPEPLGGPAPFGIGVATAESYVPGGDVLPRAEHAAKLSAEAFARLIGLAGCGRRPA
jgi:hypothetical protein